MVDPLSQDPFSIDRLRISDNMVVHIQAVQARMKGTRSRRHLPPTVYASNRTLPVLLEAMALRLVMLPGKAWFLYMLILLRQRLTRATPVTLPAPFLARYPLTSQERVRGLQHLETAGLIYCRRRKGFPTQITVLEREDAPNLQCPAQTWDYACYGYG